MPVSEGSDREADPRKYVQMAALLGHQIQDRTLRPGDRAPTITVLAAGQGGWARQTCAKAFRMLEAEGFVVRVPGLGYFIADPASSGTGNEPEQRPVVRVAELLNTGSEDRSGQSSLDLHSG